MEGTSTTHDPARLDELARLTEEYARYSNTSGFALVGVGAWMVAATLADVGGWFAFAALLYASSPLVWVILVRRARAHYQRSGLVLARDPFPHWPRRWLLSFASLGMLSASLSLVVEGAVTEGFVPVTADWTGAAALVLASWLVWRWTSGTAQAFQAAAVAGFATMLVHYMLIEPILLPSLSEGFPRFAWFFARFHAMLVALWALVGASFGAAGAVQHLRHRRLEQRLASLEGPA